MKNILLLVSMVGLLFGCTKENDKSTANSVPKQDVLPQEVTFLCPSNAGGAMDANTRLLAPYFEKHLGKTVPIVNMGGSACWVGWKYLHDAPRDGSIISYANFPNMINGYLDPNNTIGLTKDDFEFLALYTSDANAIAANKDENRFSNAAEFFEYAKNNVLTIADAGARSDDAVGIALLEKSLGYKLKHVHFQNSAEGMTALYGGHVDVWIGNVSEVVGPSRNGELKVLTVLSKDRVSYLPDVQTTYEVGIEVANASSRGIIAAKGIDPEMKDIIIKALKAAMEDPDQLQAAEKQGVAVTPIYGDDFKAWMDVQDTQIRGVFDLLD